MKNKNNWCMKQPLDFNAIESREAAVQRCF